MQYIKHRINSAKELPSLNRAWGAEIDLRSDVSRPGEILLSHDPWRWGETLEEWLGVWGELGFGGPLILNTKEDGLEARALELLEARAISHFFFLDTALPTLVRITAKRERRFAVRLSAFESLESVMRFRGRADWVWVDCFEGVPVEEALVRRIAQHFQVCLVSPELQGRPVDSIAQFQGLAKLAQAICTKNPEAWLFQSQKAA
ncbi:MAG: hypothetical protein HYR96_05715 [Deltaproteobacteria bacterium]|nr:hypothetical protein [Deltaproteobacteria bacterium]